MIETDIEIPDVQREWELVHYDGVRNGFRQEANVMMKFFKNLTISKLFTRKGQFLKIIS